MSHPLWCGSQFRDFPVRQSIYTRQSQGKRYGIKFFHKISFIFCFRYQGKNVGKKCFSIKVTMSLRVNPPQVWPEPFWPNFLHLYARNFSQCTKSIWRCLDMTTRICPTSWPARRRRRIMFDYTVLLPLEGKLSWTSSLKILRHSFPKDFLLIKNLWVSL